MGRMLMEIRDELKWPSETGTVGQVLVERITIEGRDREGLFSLLKENEEYLYNKFGDRYFEKVLALTEGLSHFELLEILFIIFGMHK